MAHLIDKDALVAEIERRNRINSLAVAFLEKQQIQPNIFSDQIIKGYKEGYHQAEEDLLDNIWHSPDEEPEIDRKIIWESENFLGKHLDKEWKPKIDCFGKKERWCYLADILPSKNWTGERPYSKVDYSRGYDNGYEQAEKDLDVLSWVKEVSGVKEMSRAKEEALKAYPPQSISADYDTINRRDAFEYGYLKAEKDLELTWKDISLINNIVTTILRECEDKILYDTEEDFNKEVLKRFKEKKG